MACTDGTEDSHNIQGNFKCPQLEGRAGLCTQVLHGLMRVGPIPIVVNMCKIRTGLAAWQAQGLPICRRQPPLQLLNEGHL